LISDPVVHYKLVKLASCLKQGGLFVVGHVILGTISDPLDGFNDLEDFWADFVKSLKVDAFVELTRASTVRDGTRNLLMLSGLGAIKPNIVILGFYETVRQSISIFDRHELCALIPNVSKFYSLQQPHTRDIEKAEYVQTLRDILKLGKNVGIARGINKIIVPTELSVRERTIDVWLVRISGMDMNYSMINNILFPLQMGYILQSSPKWGPTTRLRIMSMVHSAGEIEAELVLLRKLVECIRIPSAELDVIDLNAAFRYSSCSTEFESLPLLSQAEVLNTIIKARTDVNTAMIFTTLVPPRMDTEEEDILYWDFINQISTGITAPIVMFCGFEETISL
jgi:potassium/chloride transporter 9